MSINEEEYILVVKVAPQHGASIAPVELKLVAPKVTKVEGPYNEEGELLEFASAGETYFYYASLNVNVCSINPKQISWAVSYDEKEVDDAYHLFKGGKIENDKIKISIQIKKSKDKFKIYAYTTILPNKDVFVEVEIGDISEVLFCGTKQWGALQKNMPTQNKVLTEAELDAGLDFVGKMNVGIMKRMGKSTVKGFYEKGPLGVEAVLSKTDNIESKVINNFYTGALSKLSFDENTKQSKELKNLKSFQDYFKGYLEVMGYFIERETIEAVDENIIMEVFDKKKHNSKPSFSNKLEIISYDYYGFMGGVQTIKVDIEIMHWTKKNGVAVDYNIIKTKMYIGDWYGADWGDINGWNSKLKGNVYSLNAFFWLQHHYGCHPFETEIIYESVDKIEN
ncbi:MAG: hypothetical protein JKY08_07930 [Flavobacteriaceae bacterium]|nr:hypothetical protein [Flavobacteriaceae bacterium]